MPTFEVIVHTDRGIFTYEVEQEYEGAIRHALTKHKYEKIKSIKAYSR